jgi:hypothetical protein
MPKRLMVLLVVAGMAVAVMAVPAGATPTDNPFVGSWESYDDFSGGDFSHVRLQIGGNGNFHLRDDAATACLTSGFGFVPGTIKGDGEIINNDPWTFSGTGDLYCHTRDERGRQLLAADFPSLWIYDPVTDTLPSDFNCYYRTGSDPSACD